MSDHHSIFGKSKLNHYRARVHFEGLKTNKNYLKKKKKKICMNSLDIMYKIYAYQSQK